MQQMQNSEEEILRTRQRTVALMAEKEAELDALRVQCRQLADLQLSFNNPSPTSLSAVALGYSSRLQCKSVQYEYFSSLLTRRKSALPHSVLHIIDYSAQAVYNTLTHIILYSTVHPLFPIGSCHSLVTLHLQVGFIAAPVARNEHVERLRRRWRNSSAES